MKAILPVAHGSRRKQSNDEVISLADKLRNNCSQQYDIVNAAFLELAEVLIPDGIKQCVNDGATSIIVLPYFLNSGRHVVEDIPNIVSSTAAQHPDIDIKIAPHLGASNLMMDFLIASADTARGEIT